MTTNLDDYLDQNGFDLSDYDVGDTSDSNYDYSDYFNTDSSDSPDYSDYYDSSNDDTFGSNDLNDYLDNYDSGDTSSSDTTSSNSNSGTYNSGDYSSSDYSSGDYSSSNYPSSGDSSDYLDSYGAYGYGDDSASDKCISAVAFKSKGAKVDIAFDAIFFILYLVLLGIAAIRFFKSKRKGAALGKWFLFVVSLFFGLLYILLDIVALALNECQMLGSTRYQLILAALRWFQDLSFYTMVLLILIPVCLKLQGAGKLGTVTVIIHTAWMVLAGILLLTSLAINTRIANAAYKRDYDSSLPGLVKHLRGVGMAYYVFLFLATLLGAANMALSLFRKKNIRKGALLLGVPALILSSLGMSLVLMGGFADQNWPKKGRSANYAQNAEDAQIFLSRFFYVLSFLGALVIAGSHQEIDDDSAPPMAPPPVSQPAGYAPVPGPAPPGPM